MVTGPEVHEHQTLILFRTKMAESQLHKQLEHAQADMQMFITPGQTQTYQNKGIRKVHPDGGNTVSPVCVKSVKWNII